MGLTHVTVKVAGLEKGNPFEGEFVVDTGSIDCMAPRASLEAAGVQTKGNAVYELANGEPIEYEYGYGWLYFMGEETISRIIFGPADCEPLLGVVALESVGLMVDPITQKLKRLHAKPLKLSRSFVNSLPKYEQTLNRR